MAELRKTPIEQIEERMVAALKVGLPASYKIAAFPDRPTDVDLDNINRAALVQYVGSRYGAPSTGDCQSQEAEIAIHLYFRATGEPVRASYEIELVRMALQAQKFTGSKLYLIRDELADYADPLWHYIVRFGCKVPVIPLRRHPRPFIEQFDQQKEEA